LSHHIIDRRLSFQARPGHFRRTRVRGGADQQLLLSLAGRQARVRLRRYGGQGEQDHPGRRRLGVNLIKLFLSSSLRKRPNKLDRSFLESLLVLKGYSPTLEGKKLPLTRQY
jgi:hypothetical protein